jgi:hypothetical protein
VAEIPQEAVQAADGDELMDMLKNVRVQFWTCLNKAHMYVTWTDDVASCDTCGLTSEMTRKRDALVRAHERSRVAEQIAAAIEQATPFHWTRSHARAWAARLARQIGEAR